MLTPFRTVLLFLLASIIGWALVPSLPVDLQPSTSPKVLTVSFSLPNAAPDQVEQQATAPLENILSKLSGIRKITSTSYRGSGRVVLTFGKEADIDFKRFEASAMIRQLYPSLPKGMPYPQLRQQQPSDNESPLLTYSLKGSRTPQELYSIGIEKLVKPLSSLPNMQSVRLTGATPERIRVAFDIAALSAWGLFRDDLIAALRLYASEQHVGQVNIGKQSVFVTLPSVGGNLSSLKNIPLRKDGSIRLKDVAQVYLEPSPPSNYYRVDGKPALRLLLTAAPATNRIELAKLAKQQISDLQANLPSDMQLLLDYDDTKYLGKELNKTYYRTALSMGVLLLFTLLLYRNWRYLAVLFSGLLINISITLLVAKLLGLSIHLYSLAGLAVSFGLMLDNAIVMLDHLRRHKDQKVFTSLLAASATTIAALLLIFFLPEEDRMNLTEFGQVVAVSLATSLLVAKFYTPAVVSLVHIAGRSSGKSEVSNSRTTIIMEWYGRFIALLSQRKWILYTAVTFTFGTPIFLLPTEVEGWDWYNKTIGNETYQREYRVTVDKALGGTLRSFARNVYEKSGYRSPERTMLYVNAEMGSGHTLEQMDRSIERVEAYLTHVEGIERFVTQVYSGQYASIAITFLPEYERGLLPQQLKGRLISRSVDWSGVAWDIYGVGQGFSTGNSDALPSFRVKMKGPNYAELERQAARLAEKLLVHKRIQTVNTNERLSYSEKGIEAYELLPKKELAPLMPVSMQNNIRLLARVQQPQAQWSIQDKWHPVVVEASGAANLSLSRLLKTPTNTQNTAVQLKDWVSPQLTESPSALHKENRRYIRVVGFEYTGSTHFGARYLKKQLEELKLEMPPGYEAKQMKFNWDYNKAKRQYGLLGILILAIYFICSVLFESLKQPLAILSVIPVAFIGVFVTFAELEFFFDQGGYAAFVLLGGLSVNASIFVVSEYNRLGSLGFNGENRAVQAVGNKAVPILLTLLSTVCGLIPFLTEGQQEIFWFSLAIGTIGGLVTSLFGVFVLLPVILWKPELKKHNRTIMH